MYKSMLQEFCHKQSWKLPEYVTIGDGPPHSSRFSATVTINDESFQSPPVGFKSSKEAQNEAAKIAFNYYCTAGAASGSSTPVATKVESHPVDTKVESHPVATKVESHPVATKVESHPVATEVESHPVATEVESHPVATKVESHPVATKVESHPVVETPISDRKDLLHSYKTLLQLYAEKRNIVLPTYFSDIVGPPHNRRYKSKVTIDGKSFEGPNYYTTLKDAEHAAAKVALECLSVNETQEDHSLYKSFIQELAQKKGLPLPIYKTEKSGPPHMPNFVSTVEIGGKSFKGQIAKTKKIAEMSAAKAAYICLTDQERQSSSASGVSEVSPVILQPIVIERVEAVATDGGVIIEEQSEKVKDTIGKRPRDSSTSEDTQSKEHGRSAAAKTRPKDANEGTSSILNIHMPSGQQSSVIKQDLVLPASESTRIDVGEGASSSILDVCMQSGQQSSGIKQVLVMPSTPDMIIPEDATILPLNDNKWVAMRLPAGENSSY